VREPTADTTGLWWLVPSYIFTRVRRFPFSWELLEAVESAEAAERLLADYRALLEGQSEVEVVLMEATNARQARRKLEARGAEPN